MSTTRITTESTRRSALEETAFDAMAAKVVCAAAELGVADVLAGGPRTSAEVARLIGADGPSLRRLLLALAGIGVLAQVEPDRFALTDLGATLRSDAPDSVRALVAMLSGPETWRSWGELTASVLTGELAFERAHGMPVFEFYGRNPEQAATFDAAMAEHTRDAAPALVAEMDLSRTRTVVDVGGGDGTLVAQMLRANPHLEGVVLDLPAGLARAAARLEAAGLSGRSRVIGGDAFSAVPAGADAYVLKQVLHDWDDERAAIILRNCRRAMPPGSRLLVLERLLPELVAEADAKTLLLDVLMMLVTGGRERTGRELGDLLDAAGLALTALGEPIPPFGYRVIEAIPA